VDIPTAPHCQAFARGSVAAVVGRYGSRAKRTQSLQCAALSRAGGLPAPGRAAAFPPSPAGADVALRWLSCLTSTGGTFGFGEGIFLPSVASTELADSALVLPRCLVTSMPGVAVFATRDCLAVTVSAAFADRALSLLSCLLPSLAAALSFANGILLPVPI